MTIRKDYKDRDQRFDLKKFFFLTEEGREYLKLRAELLTNDALPDEK